jgi:hypothetical protein
LQILRRRRDAGNEEILRFLKAEIARDRVEIRSPLVLLLADGLEYRKSPREMNIDEDGLPLLWTDLHS